MGLVRSSSWIGAYDYTTENAWEWTDGSAYEYSNWNAGEPNDYGNGEDCTEIQTSGGWNDMPCTNSLTSVCEVPPSPPASPPVPSPPPAPPMTFVYVSDYYSQSDAEANCVSLGGRACV